MTPWTVTCQTPLSMEFSRQEYWSGLLFPPPGDLPNPGTEPMSPALAGGFFTTEPLGKPRKRRGGKERKRGRDDGEKEESREGRKEVKEKQTKKLFIQTMLLLSCFSGV